MKKLFLILLGTSVGLHTAAQSTQDSTMLYPVIKSYRWAGVFPVPNSTFKPDPTLNYKLAFDLTAGPKNVQDTSGFRDINWGFGEVGRRLNLHLANGIPRNKIDVVVVIHGFALHSMLNDEAYRKKYGIDNPTIPLINELKAAGIKIMVCGQAMRFINIKPEDLIPGTTVAMSAQVVLSSHSAKGYWIQKIENEN